MGPAACFERVVVLWRCAAVCASVRGEGADAVQDVHQYQWQPQPVLGDRLSARSQDLSLTHVGCVNEQVHPAARGTKNTIRPHNRLKSNAVPGFVGTSSVHARRDTLFVSFFLRGCLVRVPRP